MAQLARRQGDEPFGAVLVDASGAVLEEAVNTKITEQDPTGHAEINLVRAVTPHLDVDVLRGATLYASTEPCAMCSAAIYWSGIGRVVYALAAESLLRLIGDNAAHDVLALSSREVFARGTRTVQVDGPVLEDEAMGVHEGFWT
jgi:tRNA(Arg) A34 adenosine deaminase TadA